MTHLFHQLFYEVDLPLFFNCRKEIQETARRVSEINLFEEKLNESMEVLQKEWKKIDHSFTKNNEALRGIK